PFLAPYKVAILPLIKNIHREKAKQIQRFLCNRRVMYYNTKTNNVNGHHCQLNASKINLGLWKITSAYTSKLH
ncbi:MAG: hypothetical protein Q8877_03505, partial [Sweet potato little leaf phytoplasma]|nr:hypothetical protein [Sweet potato little leaf phytoplasma]